MSWFKDFKRAWKEKTMTAVIAVASLFGGVNSAQASESGQGDGPVKEFFQQFGKKAKKAAKEQVKRWENKAENSGARKIREIGYELEHDYWKRRAQRKEAKRQKRRATETQVRVYKNKAEKEARYVANALVFQRVVDLGLSTKDFHLADDERENIKQISENVERQLCEIYNRTNGTDEAAALVKRAMNGVHFDVNRNTYHYKGKSWKFTGDALKKAAKISYYGDASQTYSQQQYTNDARETGTTYRMSSSTNSTKQYSGSTPKTVLTYHVPSSGKGYFSNQQATNGQQHVQSSKDEQFSRELSREEQINLLASTTAQKIIEDVTEIENALVFKNRVDLGLNKDRSVLPQEVILEIMQKSKKATQDFKQAYSDVGVDANGYLYSNHSQGPKIKKKYSEGVFFDSKTGIYHYRGQTWQPNGDELKTQIIASQKTVGTSQLTSSATKTQGAIRQVKNHER